MLARLKAPSSPAGVLAAIAVSILLGGCGKGAGSGSVAQTAVVAGAPAGHTTCAQTVLDVLGRVARRIYRQGVSSERTASAAHLIAASGGLREAVERGDAVETRAAARALIAGGHMTNLRVMRGATVLADLGGPAVTPLRGVLRGVNGQAIGSYVTSVWSDEGLLAETNGVTGGRLALRVGGRSVGGSLALPPGRLPAEGTLTFAGRRYQYTSFGATQYPAGHLRVYLLKPLSATASLCGATPEDTVVNTLSRVANLIYAGEGGRRTLPQVQRVQQDQTLLQAVAARDARATKAAIEALLTEHIVRLRVSTGAGLLSDVGGPFVLAPVSAPLTLGGRNIARIVLSIQDDEGYLRLTKRLVGLRVLMYMHGGSGPQLVKNSLGPSPGAVPASGSYEYRGQRFRVFTVNARAFPSGPLTIRVLVPLPYS
ncbi:MAG TPA: hypothetical protein VGO14_02790 [Solirubrobacteraceae bacterium]|jgi:hypothetical protein|nr:hypothetical protein [Solirubrobacteraceae bacterium]